MIEIKSNNNYNQFEELKKNIKKRHQYYLEDEFSKSLTLMSIGIGSLYFLCEIIALAYADNTFISYPTKLLMHVVLKNINKIPLIAVLLFTIDLIIRKIRNHKIKIISKHTFKKIILYTALAYPIYVLTFFIFSLTNKYFVYKPQINTDKVVIIDLSQSEIGNLIVTHFIDTQDFLIFQGDYNSYYSYKKGDTLNIEIQKGFFGLPFIKKHYKTHISTQFVYHDFKLGTNKINFAPSNIYTTKEDNLIHYKTIKHNQWDICNIHYENQCNDFFQWNYYAEKSSWGNIEHWRPFSRTEILYILNKRPNAEKLRFLASVDGINGLVLLPDNWDIRNIIVDQSIPIELKRIPKTEELKFSKNKYSKQQWGIMQSYGAIFLPAAGYAKIEENKKYSTKNIEYKFQNMKGYYWTSTSLKDETKACCLVFDENGIDIRALNKNYQCTIRLIWSNE